MKGKTTIALHCLIPRKWVILNDPCWRRTKTSRKCGAVYGTTSQEAFFFAVLTNISRANKDQPGRSSNIVQPKFKILIPKNWLTFIIWNPFNSHHTFLHTHALHFRRGGKYFNRKACWASGSVKKPSHDCVRNLCFADDWHVSVTANRLT